MYCRRLFAWIAPLLACFTLGTALAQTPSTLIAIRMPGFRQVSATETQSDVSVFALQLGFSGRDTRAYTVQLQTPLGGRHPLARDARDGTFSLELSFGSRAELVAALPSGGYTIAVTSGGSTTNTAFTLPALGNTAPLLMRNFDTLQSFPSTEGQLQWSAIPNADGDDFISMTIEREDGTTVFDAGQNFFPGSTFVYVYGLPSAVPLRGQIAFANLTLTTPPTPSGTLIGIGDGFVLNFPMRVRLPMPVFTRQPLSQSIQVSLPFSLSSNATGEGVSYRWLKNGVVVPGATTAFLYKESTTPQDAGRYQVQATNTSGTVASDVATVVIAPALQITTHSGTREQGNIDGPLASARFAAPQGLVFDAAGNLYVADADNATIRKISPTGTVSTLAGAARQQGSADGAGSAARFVRPKAIAIDRTGNLYVADTGASNIRKISPEGIVTTLAGLSRAPGYSDGSGSNARFREPGGIAVDGSGNVFVADSGNEVIRQISPGGPVTTFAGLQGQRALIDGAGSVARFANPQGLAFDPQGNLLVADFINSALRRITPSGVVSTLAGGNQGVRLTPAFGRGATFFYLMDVAVARDGTVYLLDSNLGVFRMTPDGLVLHLAGNFSYAGLQDGIGSLGIFNSPIGIAVDASGALFIGDSGNSAIRRATLVPGSTDPLITFTSQPLPQTVAQGGSVALTVEAAGLLEGFQWYRGDEPIVGANGPHLLVPNQQADADYRVRIANGAGFVTSQPARVSVSTTPDVGRLVNLSIRAIAGQEAQSLLVGFAIEAPPGTNSTAPLLVRAVGPSLAPFGVNDFLDDPTLALIQSGQTLASNNDWGGTAALTETFNRVGAFPLAAASRDAALAPSPGRGSYSIRISGATSRTGTTLAELYDAGPRGAQAPRLVNVSARTDAGRGEAALIAGFVVGGSTSKTLLIRGIGPALLAFGVQGYVVDPKLELFDRNGRIAVNDDWGGDATLAAAARNVGAFNLWDPNSKDSALLITLAPGTYSAQLTPATGETGNGLVEIYEIP